jgi:hypothetical protein
MTEDEASQNVVNNLKAMGYEPPSNLMKKRVEAALGISVPLWRRASNPRREEMFMQMHRAIEAADAVAPATVNADLLAALKDIIQAWDRGALTNLMFDPIAAARAAIARAEGKDAT